MLPLPLRLTLEVMARLEELGISTLLVGSMGTSYFGLPRATIDSDVVADLHEDQVQGLVGALREEFYVDEEMVRWALEHRSMFNLVHFETSFKVDVYILGSTDFDRAEFARRVRVDFGEAGEADVATPEDLVLSKLRWYRMGNEISERQWSDVLGVFRVRGESLDWSYLREWARRLGVADLLEKALDDAQQ